MQIPDIKHEVMPRAKQIALGTVLAIGMGVLSGCPGEEEDDRSDYDRKIDCLPSSDLEGRRLNHMLDVPGESFKIQATYSTDYDVKSWKITDTKALDIKLSIVPDSDSNPGAASKTPQVLIENLHADATIKSKKSQINGLPTDSFDDRLHTGTQPGFEVTAQHPYSERFVISGFSETLTSGWGYVVGDYGSLDIDERRLTEKNLRKQGAWGQQISMVTDLLIRDTGSNGYFHKTVVDDTVIVPLKGIKCETKKKK